MIPIEYLTVEETAELLQLPLETVYKYARTRKLPASKVGRYWRFEKSKVLRWKLRRATSHSRSRQLQVMVVDDEPLFRDLCGTWMRTLGHMVDAVSDGDQAIHYLGVQVYDLVLLDLRMPTVDGLEVLRHIRSRGRETEVVIVTAHFDSKQMDEVLRLGTVTVLRKPVDRDSLVEVVERVERSLAAY